MKIYWYIKQLIKVSQNNHVEWKKLNQKKVFTYMIPFIYSRKCQLICSYRRQIDQWLPDGRCDRRDWFQRGISKLLKMMETFIILMVVMVPQLYTYDRTYQIVHFICVQVIIHQLFLNNVVKWKKKYTESIGGE